VVARDGSRRFAQTGLGRQGEEGEEGQGKGQELVHPMQNVGTRAPLTVRAPVSLHVNASGLYALHGETQPGTGCRQEPTMLKKMFASPCTTWIILALAAANDWVLSHE
jgi:hypothetical protein